MTPHKVTPTWWDHATMWNAADPTLQDAGHTTDGGRVFGITRVRYDECDHYGCRPVVVIDPEDREQVERLGRAYVAAAEAATQPYGVGEVDVEAVANEMQAALREFAAPPPPPPKPDEPLTGGSQVREADGTIWTRVEGQPNRPWVYSGSDATYAALDVVEVLR